MGVLVLQDGAGWGVALTWRVVSAQTSQLCSETSPGSDLPLYPLMEMDSLALSSSPEWTDERPCLLHPTVL